VTPPSPRASILAPFRVRSFRFQWPADLATSWGFEMEALILGWYVLVETGSVLMLTAFAALQYIGAGFAPLLGVASDRLGHRTLLCIMRAAYASLAAILMTMALTGTLSPIPVFIVTALMGIVRPSDIVMRNALIAQTMPPGLLMGGMGMSRLTAESARIAGAIVGAGLVAAFGMGPAYVVVTCLYASSLLLTLGAAGAPPREAGTTASISPWRELGEGLAHVRATPELQAALWLAFLVNLVGFPLMGGLLPYVARDVYLIDRTGLGYLIASFATGAFLGSLLIGTNRITLRPARQMIGFALGWFAMILVLAQTGTALSGAAALFVAGFVHCLSLIPMSVLLLRGAGARFRGRVMGLRILATYGLPLGLLIAGPLIGRFGFAATATIYGTVGVAITALIAIHWRRHLWPSDAPGNAR